MIAAADELRAKVTEVQRAAEAALHIIRQAEAELRSLFPGRTFDGSLLDAVQVVKAEVARLSGQIVEARDTVNDLHAFGLLQTAEADLLLLHLRDQP